MRISNTIIGLLASAAVLVPGVAVAQAPAAASAPAPAPAAAGTPVPQTSLGFRFDCLHDFNRDKGAAQGCLAVTGLRLNVTHQLAPNTRGLLRLDPFGTPVGGREGWPERDELPGAADTRLGIVDDYAVIWSPRPNLEVAVEAYEGAARVPSVSGLATANPFALTGWKQSALTVTYNLLALQDMRVKFAIGNGEGENGKNLDPQQYFGFEAGASLVKGVRFALGVSMDGNNVGSEETVWLAKKYQAGCGGLFDPTKSEAKLGYSTQRLAAGLMLDGTLPGTEGLMVGLGWQRVVASDLDKERTGAATKADLAHCARLDPDAVFVETAEGDAVNTVQRTTYALSVSYRLLERFFVAADYQTRRIDSGSVDLFEVCRGYDEGLCTEPSGNASNTLAQDAFTVGGGMTLDQGLVLSVGYFKESYDKKYTQFFYADADGKSSDTREMFDARIAYDFQ